MERPGFWSCFGGVDGAAVNHLIFVERLWAQIRSVSFRGIRFGITNRRLVVGQQNDGEIAGNATRTYCRSDYGASC